MVNENQHVSEQLDGLLRLILDTFPAPILEFELDYRIVYANRAALAALGRGTNSPAPAHLLDIVHSSCVKEVLEKLEKAVSLVQVEDIDLLIAWPDGTSHPTRMCLEVLFRQGRVRSMRASLIGAAARPGAKEEISRKRNLDTLGRLCTSFIHDINNLLNGISGHAQLALMDLQKRQERDPKT